MFFEGKVPRSNDLDQGKVPIIFIFLEERFLGQRTWTKERFLIFYSFSRKGSSIRWFGERKGSFVGEHKYKKNMFFSHLFNTQISPSGICTFRACPNHYFRLYFDDILKCFCLLGTMLMPQNRVQVV